MILETAVGGSWPVSFDLMGFERIDMESKL
jgi:hypothetical protein